MIASAAVPSAVALPIVGRERELESLGKTLSDTKAGKGSAWTLIGPGGIGKTRLLRALEQEATRLGVRTRWGYCLKESLAPFFPFEQIFRRGAEGPSSPSDDAALRASGSTVLFEEERPRALVAKACALAGDGHPLLLISRDRPSALRQRTPTLPASSEVVWLSRTESPEAVAPGALDALGERLEAFLRGHHGGVVALTGLEYLISQNSFLPVLRLVQMLRDATEAAEGRFLLSVNSSTLEDRERSLLEAEAEVVRESAPAQPASDAPEPPALRLLRYLETLQEESRAAPQLLVLDDLQWADAQSRTAFQFLVRNARELPVMFVAALRDESEKERAVPGEASLEEMLDHLEQEGILHQLRIEGLAPASAQDLVRALTGAPLAAGPSDQAFLDLVGRTEGNPYFLVESLQQLVEQGLLRREGDRTVLSLPGEKAAAGARPGTERHVPLPPTIRRLVGRRLEGLPAAETRFLAIASVIGSEFDLAPVAAVQGIPVPRLEEMASTISRQHRLLQPGTKESGWEFSHPLVWEVLREGLPKSEERQYAQELARWWEKERPQEAEPVARLWSTARDREGVLRSVPLAIDRALEHHGFDAVLRYLRWREELLTDEPADRQLRAELEIPVILRMNREGATDAAYMLVQELRELRLEPPTRWEVEYAYCQVALDTHTREVKELLPRLEQEVRAAGLGKNVDLQARILTGRMVAAINSGDCAECVAQAERSRSLPLEQVLPYTHFQIELAWSWGLREVGPQSAAQEHLHEAEALLDETMPPDARTRFLNAKGAFRYSIGDLLGAGESFQSAVEYAHRAGNITLEVLYLGNWGNVLFRRGEYALARERFDTGLGLSEKFSFDRGRAMLLRLRGVVQRDTGQLDEGEAAFRAASDWYGRSGNAFIVHECENNLSLLHAFRGEAERAVRELQPRDAEAASYGEENHAEYLLMLATSRRMAGDLVRAESDLERIAALGSHVAQNAEFRARWLYERAHVAAASGHPEKAAEYLASALGLFHQGHVIAFHGTPVRAMEAPGFLERAAPPPPG